MVSGKLCDIKHDSFNIQVMATKAEEGEELLLQDMDGVFLRFAVLKEEGLQHQEGNFSSNLEIMSFKNFTNP